MTENHYVDSKDQHTVAEGVADHSELTTMYRNVPKEELGHWMQEDERQAAIKKELDKIQTGLRKSSVLIGLSISLPIVLGILLGQLAMARADISTGITLIFILVALSICLVILTIVLYRWVGNRYQKHSVRALPITLVTLLSLALVTQKVFDYANAMIGGLIGYGIALASLLVISIVMTTIMIFAWTSPKLPALVKLLVLFLFLGGATAIFYLA